MKTITHFLDSIFPKIPLILIIVILVALLIMILTIVLIIKAVKKAKKKAAVAQEGTGETVKKEKKEQTHKLPPLIGKVSEFLTKKGFFRVSDMSLSFLKALEFLQQSIGTTNYKYRLPWFLLLGTEQSGKTSMLEGAELHLPVGQPDFGIAHPRPDCQWWFLNRGVIIDPRGKFLIESRGTGSDDKSWRTLLILLARYRSARPLNGIILTIPANEIYGRNQLPLDEINSRAQHMAQKLLSAQNSLGLRLPVYVIITKSDVISGFQSFCSEIPASNRHNMLGWSSNYSLSTAYTPSWIDEAFSFLQDKMYKLRLEIFAEGRIDEGKDGVFVFPGELLSIKDNLSVYLNRLFKSDAYNESLILRGIYFCGDSGMMPLTVVDDGNGDSEIPADAENFVKVTKFGVSLFGEDGSLSEPPISKTRKTFFLNDLISEKIFREGGIAHPIKRRLMTANRGLNIAKIGTAIFMIFGSYGLFNAYDNFIRNRNYVVPVLGKMTVLLQQIQGLKLNEAPSSAEAFDTHARQLMEMMEQLQQTSFFSLFVPASWFSSLHQDLHQTLKISYQHVILRTIYIDLLIKARNLLHKRPAIQDKSVSLAQLLNPTASAEFLALRDYIEGLEKLNEKIIKFNSLKNANDANDLNELIAFTFNTSLPDKFINQYQKFRNFIQNTIFPPIDLMPYQQMARETLNVLHQNFLNAIFSTTDQNGLPGRLASFLHQLGQQTNQQLPSVDFLRQISIDLTQAKPILGEAGKTWMDQPYFSPGPEYNKFLDKIDDSKLFGKDVSQFLVDQTSVAFDNLKAQLNSINQFLINQPSAMPIILQDKATPPSQGLLLLEKSLATLFAEPFMAQAHEQSFTTNITPGKLIYWDSKLIELADAMSGRYDEFMSKQLSSFPVTLQENIRLIGRESLRANVVSYLAKAQSFTNIPTDPSDAVAAEEILRSKISDIRESNQKFLKLLAILNQDTIGSTYVQLRSFLSVTTYWLLAQVEKLAVTFNPYAVQNGNFLWWAGKPGLAFSGFSAKDLEDLKSYVTLQRDYISHLAINFAKPLVALLAAPIMSDAVGDKTLLNRWRRIVEQVESHEKKKPGNTLIALENFILSDMNKIDLSNCFHQIPLSETKTESGDFFSDTMRNIKKKILAQAEVLKRQQSIKSYKTLATYFNANLKNKFPFIEGTVNGNETEVDAEHVLEFFQMYNELGGNRKEVLQQVYQLGKMSQDVTKFLDKIDEIKEFLKNYISEKNDVPTFDFNIDFRVNREKEEAANLIVEWYIKTNDITKIDNHAKTRNGQWRYGDKIEIGLRWPEGIAAKPSKDLNQPFMNVDGQQVTFKYTGRWALLWLLKMQKAPNSEYVLKEDNDSYILKYTVPMGAVGRSVGYVKVTLVAPVKGKTTAKPMKVPANFPNEAPNMPQDVLNVAEQSVLTDGIVEAVEDEPNTQTSSSERKSETSTSSITKEDGKKPSETPAV